MGFATDKDCSATVTPTVESSLTNVKKRAREAAEKEEPPAKKVPTQVKEYGEKFVTPAPPTPGQNKSAQYTSSDMFATDKENRSTNSKLAEYSNFYDDEVDDLFGSSVPARQQGGGGVTGQIKRQ